MRYMTASPLSMDRFYHNAGVTVNNTVGRPSALILQVLWEWAKNQIN
nr:MAG TPA: hypothetical protein [Myoviridae sp. ct6nn14]